jgi:small subunit ribosomal protein S10e
MKALQSLKSRGFVTETFSWQYYYYILTEEGINFLRAQLNLPESVVPATIAKAMKAPVSERPSRGIYILFCFFMTIVFIIIF